MCVLDYHWDVNDNNIIVNSFNLERSTISELNLSSKAMEYYNRILDVR